MILVVDPNAIAATGLEDRLESTILNLGINEQVVYSVQTPRTVPSAERVILFDAPNVEEYSRLFEHPIIASKKHVSTLAQLVSSLFPSLPSTSNFAYSSGNKPHSYWVSNQYLVAQPLCIYSTPQPDTFLKSRVSSDHLCSYCGFTERLFKIKSGGRPVIDTDMEHNRGVSYAVIAQGITVMRGLGMTIDVLRQNTEEFVYKFGKGIHWPNLGENVIPGTLFDRNYIKGKRLMHNYALLGPQQLTLF